MTEVVASSRRRPQQFATQRCAVLHPAVAEAASRSGASAVGLVAVDGSPGLDVHLDRVGVSYDDGRSLGDPSSPVRLTASVVGGRSVPARPLPEVVARIRVGRDPVDVTDPDDVRWLHAGLPPDRPDEDSRLAAAISVAATAPPVLLRGHPVALVAAAVERVPADALPVVITCWALSALPPAKRPEFLARLGEVAAGRPVAWVSVEGVGVAPGVPTLGDRRASGHSIIGLTVFDGSSVSTGALGRCWSRGRLLSWLAGP